MCDVDDQAGIVIPSGGSGAKASYVKKIDITELTPNRRLRLLLPDPALPGAFQEAPQTQTGADGSARRGRGLLRRLRLELALAISDRQRRDAGHRERRLDPGAAPAGSLKPVRVVGSRCRPTK